MLEVELVERERGVSLVLSVTLPVGVSTGVSTSTSVGMKYDRRTSAPSRRNRAYRRLGFHHNIRRLLQSSGGLSSQSRVSPCLLFRPIFMMVVEKIPFEYYNNIMVDGTENTAAAAP